MRKHWIDNLRWVTILLVLLYHVFYFYNNKGVFGGIGGFGGTQPQDVVMYILYPWFMPLLFLVAGICSRYALERHSAKEWFKARTRKLLVPATIGLFVFQWMTGYFNTLVAEVGDRTDLLAAVPGPVKYIIWSISGTGPLWFIQDLWLFSLLLLLLRKIIPTEKVCLWCSKANIGWIILLGVLFWLGNKTMILEPRPETADGLFNLYKPLFYLILYLLGYYVFSNDSVQEKLRTAWIPLLVVAAIAGISLVITTFGQDNTTPQYLGSPLNCIYGWFMCLAMMGWFHARFDCTSGFADYMTRSSYGIYIVHYLPIASIGYMMKVYTTFPPVAMYLILLIAVFVLSPLLNEIIRRIPIVRWCVLGEK